MYGNYMSVVQRTDQEWLPAGHIFRAVKVVQGWLQPSTAHQSLLLTAQRSADVGLSSGFLIGLKNCEFSLEIKFPMFLLSRQQAVYLASLLANHSVNFYSTVCVHRTPFFLNHPNFCCFNVCLKSRKCLALISHVHLVSVIWQHYGQVASTSSNSFCKVCLLIFYLTRAAWVMPRCCTASSQVTVTGKGN